MKLKKLVAGVLCSALVLTSAVPAAACTAVYVGSDVSANGSTYMGRSEDIGGTHTKIFGVSEARDYPADYVYEDAYGFKMPYGGHVYRYTYTQDSPAYGEGMDDFEPYAEAGQNEKGVAMSATVSVYYGEQAAKADPVVDTGICEISLGTILLGKSATAREGVELLASIVDKYGAGETNQITISDAKETWYFEIVSGHQYAAIKLPADKVLVNPNIMMLGVIDVNDKENVVASKDLVKVAKDNGFLVTNESGKIDVAKSYDSANAGAGQYERYMQGMFYINKAEAQKIDATLKIDKKNRDYSSINNNSADSPISLLHNPDRKMTTYEILRLLATRGEGTPYAQEEGLTGYSIGNPREAECHIFEIRENMPDALATIQWQTNAPSEFAIYVPYYSALVTSVNDEYNVESLEYVDNSYFWLSSKLNILCSEDRANRAGAVKEYFAEYQKSLIEQQKAVDTKMQELYKESPAKASVVATLLGKNIAQQTYATVNQVKKELEAYIKAGKSGKFVLSDTVKKTMPNYAGLINTYADDVELLKALNAEAEGEQDKLVEANEKIAALETALKSAQTIDYVKATKVTTTTKASKGSVKVSWKKSGSTDVDSYRIYRATSKNGTYKMVKEVKGTETSVKLSTKSLKAGKTYYYKVRGVKTVDGKKAYTSYSAAASAKVK